MATNIGANYDPPGTAAALAEAYVSSRQDILSTQTKRASATAAALTKLKSAISAYQTSLLSLSSTKTLLSRSAAFSNTSLGTATASASAAAGSYSFFVERLATANQIQYHGLTDTPAGSGTIDVKLGGMSAFTVDLSTADTDVDGVITPRELAAAINAEPDNASKVSASIVTIGSTSELILTSQSTGAGSAITLTTSAVTLASPPPPDPPATDTTLQDALASPTQVVAAQDAKVWLGAQGSGSAIIQATNTFTNIEGVSMTFTKAQAGGEAPVTLTVAADNAGTTANVQKFVDNYNTLKSAIDALVNAGDPAEGAAAGAFSNDGGIRALQGRLVSILRQADASGNSVAAYGIIARRDGTLQLDSARLTKQLALNPNGLDTLIGSATGASPSGIAGNLDTYLKQWSSSVDGQIKQRQEANSRLQTMLATRQTQIDKQYDNAYKRYLAQFSQLQALQGQMASNTSMFDALFGDKSN